MSQQELRYLWVLVSLSATEWVQEVLLEGHPSWKYLEEVHTLLLDVKQGLPVSRAEVQVATVGACVRVCVWPKTIKGEGKGVESSGMSWRVWEKWGGGRVVDWAWGARDAPETLLCSATLGESLIPLTLFPHLRKEGKRGRDRWVEHRGFEGDETFLYDAVTVSIIAFVKAH